MNSKINTADILARADLRALAEQAGAEFSKDNRAACPLHGGHDKSAFGIFRGDDGMERWKCFSECGAGDAIDFVKRWKGLSFVHACEYLTGGKIEADPAELERIAQERERRAAAELEAARVKYAAALADLRNAQDYLAWHNSMTDTARQLWRDRGISDEYQDLYQFGYVAHGGHYAAPALSIPVWDDHHQLQSVRLRLLAPDDPKDKYRPVQAGLKAANFYADPGLPVEAADWVLVVEGEIKAAAVMCAIAPDNLPATDTLPQIIGVPGKENGRLMHELAGKIKGARVFVNFDPDATRQAVEFAKMCGGAGVIRLPAKIDDYMIYHGLDNNWLTDAMKSARWVK